MPNRTRAGKCINAVSAAAHEFGMMKKGKAQKKFGGTDTALGY